MELSYELLKDTPVFKLIAPGRMMGMERVTGATRIEGGWRMPAYYPLGMWGFEEFDTLLRGRYQATPEARRAIDRLIAEDRAMADLDRRYSRGLEIGFDVPEGWFSPTPYAHQMYGIARSTLRWRDYLLWEMGTGKTKTIIEMLRFMKRDKEVRRTLVLAPPVVLPTWARQVREHSQGQLTSFLWDSSHKRFGHLEHAEKADVVVTSYSRLRDEFVACLEAKLALEDKTAKRTAEEKAALQQLVTNQFTLLDYDMIVADEIHTIGNWDSQMTMAAIQSSVKAKRRIGLTGTPGDRPDRLYSQFRFLSPGLMPMGFDEFQARYVRKDPARKFLIRGYSHLEEINFAVTRIASHMKKADCLTLPPVTFIDVPVVAGPRQAARYNEMVLTMKVSEDVDLSYFFNPPKEIEFNKQAWDAAKMRLAHSAVRLVKLLQVSSGFIKIGPDKSICDACSYQEPCVRKDIQPYTPSCKVVQQEPETVILRDFENPKLETARWYVEQLLGEDPTNKAIIWTLFHEELDDLEQMAKELGVGYVRVDGTNTSKIQKWEDAFQKDPKCRLYLGQVASGVGITLTKANYTLYYSLPYYPIHYKQSLERNNRPGQDRPMTVYRFMVQDTLDMFIARLLANKDLVEYSMTELIACGTCDRNRICTEEGIRPFRPGCKYQPDVNRLVAVPELIRRRT